MNKNSDGSKNNSESLRIHEEAIKMNEKEKKNKINGEKFKILPKDTLGHSDPGNLQKRSINRLDNEE